MRLIDADELEEILEGEGFNYCALVVWTMPTIDAEPVRHGKWIENDNGTYSCSECKSWIPKEQHYYARYCLHCGALMEGAEE